MTLRDLHIAEWLSWYIREQGEVQIELDATRCSADIGDQDLDHVVVTTYASYEVLIRYYSI